jgi:hypothetical protein
MAVTYMHRGATVGTEERHHRSAGTLIFVCVVALASALPKKSIGRSVALLFCGLMSIAGVCFMVRDARWAANLPADPYSRIRQDGCDIGAIEFVQAAFARDGRDDLFVLESPGVASAFPPGARVLFAEFLVQTESAIAERHYSGSVRGAVYLMMRTATAQTVKGALLRSRFTAYPANAWETHQFGNTTVFVQGFGERAGRDAPPLFRCIHGWRDFSVPGRRSRVILQFAARRGEFLGLWLIVFFTHVFNLDKFLAITPGGCSHAPAESASEGWSGSMPSKQIRSSLPVKPLYDLVMNLHKAGP